jgi:hypothetical protein
MASERYRENRTTKTRAKHDRWRKVMPPRGIGNGGGRQKGRAPPPANDARAVNERGIEYEAEKLTGSRAQRGNLPGGEPR